MGIAIRKVWHLPWRTYNNMLAHVAGVMELVFNISNMGQYSSNLIMGANIKLFNDKYCMDERWCRLSKK